MEANFIEIDPSEHGIQVKGTIAGGKAKYFIKFNAHASQHWLHHAPHRHDLHIGKDGVLVDCYPTDLQSVYDEIKAVVDLANKHSMASLDHNHHEPLHLKARHAREVAEAAIKTLSR